MTTENINAILKVTEHAFYDTLRGQNTYLIGPHCHTDSATASFNNCEFEHVITVEHNHTAMGSMIFRNCVFNHKVSIVKSLSLTFEGCRFLSEFELSGSKVEVMITNCIFEKEINYSSGGMNDPFNFSTNILKNNFKISGHFHGGISISDNGMTGDLFLSGIETPQAVYLQGETVGKIHIRSNNKIRRGITISRFLGNDLSVNDTEAGYISLRDITFKSLTMLNNTSSQILLTESVIDEQFELEARKLQLFQATGCKFGRLWIHENIPAEAKIKLWDVTCKEIDLVNIENEGKMEFNGVTITETFGIHTCNLGKMDFINCRLTKASMIFKNSKVTEIFTSVTEFPKIVFGESGADDFQAQLLFGQLNKAMNNMGDSVKAAEYQSREIHAHYRQLHFFRKSIFFFNLTKFNLGMNLLSNNFGRSWGRAVVFSFGFGLFFFYFLTISTSAFKVGWPMEYDWNLVPSFFRFMNPLRFFETEKIYEPLKKTVSLSPFSYIIDFFARVVIAYGFYQIIQAFRRLGKS
jgi:hypothetical protein